jgi:HPt (histidine-containing phosphotransfer) domain-containing protein
MDVVFDKSSALERVDGDADLLRELAALFLEEVPALLAAAESAVERSDGAALRQAAHSLKGSASNLSALAAAAAARQLEQMGAAHDFATARDAFAVLAREVERLKPALAAF